MKALVESEVKLRENRRVNQQRYRIKINQHAESLESDTRRLKQEIRRLEIEYNRPLCTPTEKTPWSVVAEYYRLFRHGSQVPISREHTFHPREAQIQKTFLHQAMATNICVNSGFGIDALLKEWTFVPQKTGSLAVQLVRLEYDDRATMLATVKVLVTITEEVLQFSFSHLIDMDNRLSPLAEKLLGRQIVIPIMVRFEWDATTAQVASLYSTPDLVNPFTKVLGSLKGAARVLNNSPLAVALGAASI
ncbi:hypothetical protein F442_02868 [Phytophthora nicotianae P10297]|uniref:BZIP domain-containing protein n=2 Tax=Phytophthora nicotianae TaxID=4792 RepID=W2ZYP8_PHYNI|nr:hypothetical protein L917_02695 [Phytophthora nicotianae]ETM53785.1 hypothetical protein L914_02771 [Phytophthora nicotianae]ETP52071.1 hypothetical protein F442_02868 [Phytophthora nicotianae P10297]